MNVEIITKADLENFKNEIIKAVEKLLSKQDDTPDYLRSKDVRRKLGNIASSTLQYYRDTGKLKSKKVGKSYFYESSSVEEFLDNVA